ncbi:Cytosolic 5' nucleotidase III [Fasciolopsis buskii]|uniref:5'-nucleotidase n=1 Tax=Fasciolopsis buskii TaxID=27845 RepID=A0A8E0VJ63_9TREM|nr:Cytosolic 5' nucleotidase III [Fasciolopsis buski]
MSKYRHNGILTPTCHGIFEMDPELTESAKSKLKLLRDKYYPIEIDPLLSDSDKVPHMLEWWNVSHETIVGCGLHRDALVKTVRESCVVLRNGVREFMELLWKQGIPVLIFSAGLGDVIEILLKNFNMYRENIRVVSNFMKFNEEGIITGFKDPVIHSFNKTAASIAGSNFSEMTSMRSSVILLGDSTADVHMADGATIDDPQGILSTVLRVGFLNESVETHLDKYKDIYDIVLVNDDSFTVPLAIVQSILSYNQTPIENIHNSAQRQ